MRYSGLLPLAVAISVACPATAGTITYTGADLYNSPAVSFPSVQPNVVGTSLEFPKGSGHNAMQLKLPLQSASGYAFSLSLTRTGTGEWDPHFLLGDGSTMLGGVYGDEAQGGLAFNCVQANCEAQHAFNSLFGSNDVPILGTLVVDIVFRLDEASTAILLSFSGASTGSGGFTFNTPLNKNTLFFTLLDDDDPNSSYRLNSLSVTPVPLPPAIALQLTGLGLFGLLAWHRKRKATRAALSRPNGA